jgi:hypothetical protein
MAEKALVESYPALHPKDLALCISREKYNSEQLRIQITNQKLLETQLLEKSQYKKVIQHTTPQPGWGRFQSLKFSKYDLQKIAEKELSLVPIRLDIEFEGYRLRDTLTWNLNGI